MFHVWRILIIVCTTFFGIQATMAAPRVALVIGNSAYKHVAALPNPQNDADDISIALFKIGFQVTTVKDLDYNGMRLALRKFSSNAIGSEVALVYYAGHGIEVDKNNYLIPIDAKLKSDIDVKYEAMPLDLINEAVSGAKGLRLILLDACRDNPFAKSMTRTIASRSIGRGLARIEPTVGTLVSYAAKEGTVASDGNGRNSPYTKALIKHLDEEGLEIQFLFRRVRDSVIESTGGKQEPFTYGSLPGKRIFLKPLQPKSNATSVPVDPVLTPTQQVDNSVELAFWDTIKGKQSSAFFQTYLNRYPQGIFKDVALLEIQQLEQKEKTAKADALKARQRTDLQNKTERETLLKASEDARKLAEERIAKLEAQQRKLEQVASLTTEASRAITSDTTIIRQIQSQLNRVGCEVGSLDGVWGKASISALKRFNEIEKQGLEVAAFGPSRQLLEQLQRKTGIVCPPVVKKWTMGRPCKNLYSEYRKKTAVSAFAMSADGEKCYSAWDHESRKSARNAAMQGCRKQGHAECKILSSSGLSRVPRGKSCIAKYREWRKRKSRNRAFAVSGSGHGCGWAESYKSIKSARRAALQGCRKHRKGCHIISSARR